MIYSKTDIGTAAKVKKIGKVLASARESCSKKSLLYYDSSSILRYLVCELFLASVEKKSIFTMLFHFLVDLRRLKKYINVDALKECLLF